MPAHSTLNPGCVCPMRARNLDSGTPAGSEPARQQANASASACSLSRRSGWDRLWVVSLEAGHLPGPSPGQDLEGCWAVEDLKVVVMDQHGDRGAGMSVADLELRAGDLDAALAGDSPLDQRRSTCPARALSGGRAWLLGGDAPCGEQRQQGDQGEHDQGGAEPVEPCLSVGLQGRGGGLLA